MPLRISEISKKEFINYFLILIFTFYSFGMVISGISLTPKFLPSTPKNDCKIIQNLELHAY
jgi:hypothetical protein